MLAREVHPRDPAGWHGGTAPTTLRDTRRDRPPCPSGLRANTYVYPVTHPDTLPPRDPAGWHRGTAPTALHGTRRDWPPCLSMPPCPSGLRANTYVYPVTHPNTLPPRDPAGWHGGTAPTTLRDTRRDRPPCPSGLRAIIYVYPVTHPNTLPPRDPAGWHGGTAPTTLRDTRRDRPPCPSGLRANTYRLPGHPSRHSATARPGGLAPGHGPNDYCLASSGACVPVASGFDSTWDAGCSSFCCIMRQISTASESLPTRCALYRSHCHRAGSVSM